MVCNLRHANTALFTSAGAEENEKSFKTACEWCLSEQPAWAHHSFPKKLKWIILTFCFPGWLITNSEISRLATAALLTALQNRGSLPAADCRGLLLLKLTLTQLSRHSVWQTIGYVLNIVKEVTVCILLDQKMHLPETHTCTEQQKHIKEK